MTTITSSDTFDTLVEEKGYLPDRARRKRNPTTDHSRDTRPEPTPDFTEMELLFIEAFCTTAEYDAKKAAEIAGYASPKNSYLLVYNRPKIKQAILERMRYEKITAAEVVNKLGQIFRSDARMFHKIEEYEEEVNAYDAEGNPTRITVTKKRVVQDLVAAYESDAMYSIKDIEYYKSGEIKKVTHESKMEAIKLLGAVFGLFGTKEAGDDWGRSWVDRAQSSGYTMAMVTEEMVKMFKEQGKRIPMELVEGIFNESGVNIAEQGEVLRAEMNGETEDDEE